MRFSTGQFLLGFTLTVSLLVVSYLTMASLTQSPQKSYKLVKLFPQNGTTAVEFDKSIIANPLVDISQGRALIIVPGSNGIISALEGDTGRLDWQLKVPTPVNQEAELIATPVMIDTKLVVIYQCLEKGLRTSHRMIVIDLVLKQVDKAFPELVLSAEKPAVDGKGVIKFNAPTAFSHAALKHASKRGAEWGLVYASFGNSGDTQPFHGWLFEIDLDAWQQQGVQQAVSNVLLTTPESECPVTIESGTQEMICGGGIWTPTGPPLYPTKDSYELFVPVGNGQVDLTRSDYANTLMRVGAGLQFDPDCDDNLCKNFNASEPDSACMASCKNLFMPRLAQKNTFVKPASGECNDKSFTECLAWMDYDLGASAPVKVELKSGHSVLVQPGKEGAVYLIDAKHLGTQYDRSQIVDGCGTRTDPCKAGWMGMIVTQPALTFIDGEPVVVVPTFMPDNSHTAGLVALRIVLETGQPRLKRIWQYPAPSNSLAIRKFRSHPSLPVISTLAKDIVVWTVDIGNPGILYAIRVKDGRPSISQPLVGTGRQLSTPIIYDNKVYLASTNPRNGKAMIEAYRVVLQNN